MKIAHRQFGAAKRCFVIRVMFLYLYTKKIAMEHCVSGKRMYSSQQVAEEVLIEAWTRYEYSEGNGPVAVYKCEDCGQYHLTSRGPMNDKLSAALSGGKIQRQKEADRWLDKIRRR